MNNFFIENGLSYKDIVPVIVGSEDCEPNHSYGPAQRGYYLIHYCVKGEGSFETARGKYSVRAGNFFLIKPNETTFYRADGENPWSYVWIGFNGDKAKIFDNCRDVCSYSEDTFKKIAEAVNEGIKNSEIYISLIFELIYNIFFTARRSPDTLLQVKNYIDINFVDDLTVEKISEYAGYDRRYLSRAFKKRYGFSIKEYIIKVRLSHAAKLIESGAAVVDAAIKSGYTDQFNFSKMFKKFYGVSPSFYNKCRTGENDKRPQ